MYETEKVNYYDVSSLIEEYESFEGDDLSSFIQDWVDRLNTRR